MKSVGSVVLAGLLACDGQSVVENEAPTIIRPVDFDALDLQSLISFDVYRDGDRIHALFAARRKHEDQNYVGYARSDDGGQTWLPPVEITQDPALLALESRIGNDVQIAAHGEELLVVWQVTGEIPGMGPLISLSSHDGGRHWMAGVKPSAVDTDQSHPDLIAGTHGDFHLVWLDDRDENGYQGLRYARTIDVGLHWRSEQTIDDSSCSCCWNRLAEIDDGQVMALYRDMDPRDMALARSSVDDPHWQPVGTVGAFDWHFDGCPHNGGALAPVGGGTIQALVWTGADQKVGLYHLKSADNGGTWAPPRRMGDDTAFHSDLAALDASRVLAVWDALDDKGARIMMSLSSDGGESWSEPDRLSKPTASASFPRAMAVSNGWLVFWQDQMVGGPKRWVATLINNN